MLRIFLLLFILVDSTAQAIHFSKDTECVGCHLPERGNVEKRFPSGFGTWDDSQCYGCHAELVEVSMNVLEGKEDKRLSSLPISDERIRNIRHHPLPYLTTKEKPWAHKNKDKLTADTLIQFLKRPHGRCMQDDSCYAPRMMAYPDTDNLISTKAPKQTYTPESTKEGAAIFAAKCQSCHEFSDISGYDKVALSLFSSEWIYEYANSDGLEVDGRQMPKINVSKEEARALFGFFQNSRGIKEAEVDKLVKQVLVNFKNKNEHISDRSIEYVWNEFWREGDCVHCHAIGGRASKAFDTSLPGILAWLKNNRPEELVERLLIRHVEKRLGLGSSTPGMPMTREPIPLEGITIVSTWINHGCPDLDRKTHCVRHEKNNNVLMTEK